MAHILQLTHSLTHPTHLKTFIRFNIEGRLRALSGLPFLSRNVVM